jgi:hypothetical protein
MPVTLSDDEQRILEEIELGLRFRRTEAGTLSRGVRRLFSVMIVAMAVVTGVTLVRSAAAGLTLLVGFGLLGVIGYLHRYNLRHPV